MDFSVIYQLRTKKFWWMDVIFYFVMSLLVATVLCWLIFLTKNNIQKSDIEKETVALQTVGTASQKAQEAEVINYQAKISEFSDLLKNHEFASNAFAFLQTQTMPNVWFSQFSLDEKSATVQLSGESDSFDSYSRQVAAFEKNKYIKDLGGLSSSLGESARVSFGASLTLDQSIFSYLSDASLAEATPSPTPSPTISPTPLPSGVVSALAGASQVSPSPAPTPTPSSEDSAQNYQAQAVVSPAPKAAENSGYFSLLVIISAIIVVIIAAIIVGFFLYQKKFKNKKQNAS